MSDESFKMIKEVLYLKMERDEENNIFNNMNNFSRDEFVFNETIKHCMYFFEELVEERDRLQKGMNHFYQKLIKSQDANKILKENVTECLHLTAMRNPEFNTHKDACDAVEKIARKALREIEES